MIIEIKGLSEEEKVRLNLSSTYFSVYYNRSRRYQHVYDALSPLAPKSVKEIWCLITNTARALKSRAEGIKIPRHHSAFRDNKQGIRHSQFVILLDKLEQEGYLNYYRGGLINMDVEERQLSIYIPTPKYLALWEGVDVSKEKIEYSFLQVRDRFTKELLSTRRRKGAADIAKMLQEYNAFLETVDIAVNGVSLPSQQYARIFTENMERGGRYYNLSGSVQTMPSSYRKTITINGEATAELDFKALHPSILYEQVEKVIGKPVDMEDPYNIDLTGLFKIDESVELPVGHNPARNLVKQVLLKGLNARDAKATYGTLVSSWIDEHKKGVEGAFYGLVPCTPTFPAKALCERVVAAHPLIKEAFFSDVGLLLMKIDSDIITKVLRSFMDIGVCALSWHDSVVVPEKYVDMAYAQMLKAYKEVVGGANHCRIERE